MDAFTFNRTSPPPGYSDIAVSSAKDAFEGDSRLCSWQRQGDIRAFACRILTVLLTLSLSTCHYFFSSLFSSTWRDCTLRFAQQSVPGLEAFFDRPRTRSVYFAKATVGRESQAWHQTHALPQPLCQSNRVMRVPLFGAVRWENRSRQRETKTDA